ncbi:MAG TPA: hypothetical protein VFH78_09145 [Candidatus Thermoplasmatota archaeon]|nr:hypothetical protein [Candidatus Thermoplasmatota archaeon]
MRRALLAALLLAPLVLALPTAQACSWAMPRPLERISFLEDGTLVGATDLFAEGRVDLVHGTVRGEWRSPAYVSPDGRHVVFARAGPDVQTGPSVMADTCGFHLSRHLVAYDLVEGSVSIAERGPLWGAGVAPDGLAVFDGREMRVLEWGTWRVVRAEPAPHVVRPLQYRDGVLLTLDGERYLDRMTGTLRRLDGSDPRPLADEGEWRGAAAFSPDGAHVAAVAVDEGTHELRVFRLSDHALVARERLAPAARAWAWGAEGLAWLELDHERNATVAHLWSGAPEEGGRSHRSFDGVAGSLAWSPRGELAVSFPEGDDAATLRFLGPELEVEREVRVRVVRDAREPFESALAQLPVPEYTKKEMAAAAPPRERQVPAVGLAVVAAAAVLVALSRRG